VVNSSQTDWLLWGKGEKRSDGQTDIPRSDAAKVGGGSRPAGAGYRHVRTARAFVLGGLSGIGGFVLPEQVFFAILPG